MQPKDKRRLLRKWEKQRLALQSKIEAVLAKTSGDEVAIKRFTIDWENAGINLYSSGSEPIPPHEERKALHEAAQKCQPEISELAKLVDRSIKEQEELYKFFLGKLPAPKWPDCMIEANRALAGLRN